VTLDPQDLQRYERFINRIRHDCGCETAFDVVDWRSVTLVQCWYHKGPLTFEQVATANRVRAARWHPGFPLEDSWNLADWSNAMCGEAGEAANVVKKLRRYETLLAGGPDDPSPDELREMLADELADVFCYLDLLATKAGIDLAAAIISKFNRVSERQSFPERL
jgi:NTP pyrophosphatase (non-canonical NTP hydrolase)